MPSRRGPLRFGGDDATPHRGQPAARWTAHSSVGLPPGTHPHPGFHNKLVAGGAMVGVICGPRVVALYRSPGPTESNSAGLVLVQTLRFPGQPKTLAFDSVGSVFAIVVATPTGSDLRLYSRSVTDNNAWCCCASCVLHYTPDAIVLARHSAGVVESPESRCMNGVLIGLTSPAGISFLVRVGKTLRPGPIVTTLLGVFGCAMGISPSGQLLSVVGRNGLGYVADVPWLNDDQDGNGHGSTLVSSVLARKQYAFQLATWAEKDVRATSVVFLTENALAVCTWSGESTLLQRGTGGRWVADRRISVPSPLEATPGAWCCAIDPSSRFVIARSIKGEKGLEGDLMSQRGELLVVDVLSGTISTTVLPSEVRGLAALPNLAAAVLTVQGDIVVYTPDKNPAFADSPKGDTMQDYDRTATLLCRTVDSEVHLEPEPSRSAVSSTVKLTWQRRCAATCTVQAEFIDHRSLRAAQKKGKWPVIICSSDALVVVFPELAYIMVDETAGWQPLEMPPGLYLADLHGRQLLTLCENGTLRVWRCDVLSDQAHATISLDDKWMLQARNIVAVPSADKPTPEAIALVDYDCQSRSARVLRCKWQQVSGGTPTLVIVRSSDAPVNSEGSVPWETPPTRAMVWYPNIGGFDIFYSRGSGGVCGAHSGNLWAVHTTLGVAMRWELPPGEREISREAISTTPRNAAVIAAFAQLP